MESVNFEDVFVIIIIRDFEVLMVIIFHTKQHHKYIVQCSYIRKIRMIISHVCENNSMQFHIRGVQ
jgi:hypothetical protein